MKRVLQVVGVLYMGVAAYWMTTVLRDPASGLLTPSIVERVGDHDYRDRVVEVRGAYWEERDLVVLCLRGRLRDRRRESDYSLRVPVPLLVSNPEGAEKAGFERMIGSDGLGWSIPREYLGPPCSPALVSGVVPAERLEVTHASGGFSSYYLDDQEVRALRVDPPSRAAVAAVSVVEGVEESRYGLRVALVTAEPNAAGEYATGVETQAVSRDGNPTWRWAVPATLIADGILWPAHLAPRFLKYLPVV